MAIDCQITRTVYHAVPKVACTSLKTLFWTLNHEGNSVPLEEKAANLLRRLRGRPPRPLGIHHRAGYETVSFDASRPVPAGYESFAVVRDPLARLKSAWSNKVTSERFEHREEDRAISRAGLPLEPGFAEFIENYDAYRSLSGAARDHTEHFSVYLGPTRASVYRLFRMEEMPDLESWLSARAGRPITVPRENRTEADTRDASVPSALHDRLRAITRSDYDWLEGLYSFEAGLARL
ncbi:MAG: sulfotransferase family 2 domain-containing protein [Notoacmeibacter sp.]|nr:sulfotransferase family 2 domain-containing protein [Notoacmeibacter sp.]